MALSASTVGQSESVANTATFFFTTTSTTAIKTYVHCGFLPRYVLFENLTDRIRDEYVAGMTADTSLHTLAAGTRSLTSSGGITLENGTSVSTALSVITPDGALTLSPASGTFILTGFSVPAALMVASKSFMVVAHG